MELAFRYSATDSRNRAVSGMIFAGDADLAYTKLKRNGFQPRSVVFNAPASLRNLLHPGFDARDLVRFYRTLGRRTINGRGLDEGLAAASQFVRDEKLRQAAMLMRQALLDGRRESEAMQQAGFARRDVMVIRAAEKSGRTGEMFLSLANDAERALTLKQSVRQVFRIPLMMLLLVYGFMFVVIHWLSPRTVVFLENIGAQLPAFNQVYFAFAAQFNQHIILAGALYLALPFAAYAFSKSALWQRLVDRVSAVRELSTKADYAALWHGFSLLYDAAIAPMEAARTMADAALRADARIAFLALERALSSGAYLDAAVERAQFPNFIVDGVRAAVAGGNVVAGLQDMTQDLSDDVQSLTKKLREDWSLISLFVMAGLVVVFFFVSYYPMIAVAMRNV